MKTIEEIKQLVIPVAQKYQLEQIDLFGSYAMNTQHTDSDID